MRQRETPGPRVRGGRGALIIDDRLSGGEYREMATLTCAHCNRVVVLNPQRTRERGYCAKCHAYVCDSVGCNAECNPIEQGVELALKHTDSGEAFLLRGPNGEILFDPKYKDQEKLF